MGAWWQRRAILQARLPPLSATDWHVDGVFRLRGRESSAARSEVDEAEGTERSGATHRGERTIR